LVTASLSDADFSAGEGTLLSNYVLPVGDVSGEIGEITRKELTIALTGSVSRTYDGTFAATLASSNYALSGMVGGDALTVNATQGRFASKDAGRDILVTASLSATDLSSSNGALASNYALPATASGVIGEITPKALLVGLVGSVTKVYDATPAVSLTASNYAFSGLVGDDSFAISRLTGNYASKDVGKSKLVSVSVSPVDFSAGGSTIFTNYKLPSTISGAIGEITPRTLTYTANPSERPANTANPVFTGSVMGFAGEDTLPTATMGSLAFATDATTASPVGLYAVNGSGLTAANYVFQQASSNTAALTIRAALPNVTQIVVQNVVSSAVASAASSVKVAPVPAPAIVSAPVAKTASPAAPAPAPVAKAAPAPAAAAPAPAPAAKAAPAPAAAPAAPTEAAPAPAPASATPPPAEGSSGTPAKSDPAAAPAAEPAPASDSAAPAPPAGSPAADAAPPPAADAAPPPAASPAAPAPAPASGGADSAPQPAQSPPVAVVSVAAAPVDVLPPSPVPDTPPPTPADVEDGGDPVLQSVSDAPAEAPQAQRVGAIVSQLSPQVSVSVSLPIKVGGAAGVDTRYSLAGNPGGF
jgi:hypothetical protein